MLPDANGAVVQPRRMRAAWVLLVAAAASCENTRWPENSPPGASTGSGGPCTGEACDGEPEPQEQPDPYAGYAPVEARALAAAAANEVLSEHCGSCHGAEAAESGRVEAGFDNVDRIENLVNGPLVSRCWSERSPLVAVLQGAEWAAIYHATLSTAGAPAEQVAAVADFIDRDCKRLAAICEADPAIAGCGMVAAETWLGRNCGECHGGKRDNGGIDGLLYIENVPKMIYDGQVVPCRSEESSLVTRLNATERLEDPHTVPTEDVDRLVSFIDDMEGLCSDAAPDFERGEVETMLRRSCGECHGGQPGDAIGVDGGLAQIDDLSALTDAGVVRPCQGSSLVASIIDGNMPPPGSPAPAPSLEEVDRLLSVIERPCLLPGSSTEGDARRLTERRRLDALAALPPWEREMRPDVPPVENECFGYLGDWIRCEGWHTDSPSTITVNVTGTIDDCMRECLGRADCVAVTDWSWLNDPDLGCALYQGQCNAPGPTVWSQEDGAREYRKTCSP